MDKRRFNHNFKFFKNNKSRDPHGLASELFKPGVIGQDLFNSMLILFNQVKETLINNDKLDLNNDRGIFIVNILMKLVYRDK